MRALLSQPPQASPAAVDLVEAYSIRAKDVPTERPFVRCNMISTFDGAISFHGRSGAVGGPPDRKVFQALRSLADVILVGAGTVRSEHYGPVRLDDEALREARLARGQSPVPPIAVVTKSGTLDWSSPFFTDADARPIVFTTDDCDEGTRQRAASVAEVVVAGTTSVDPRLVLDHLQQSGDRSVLLEGGPGLNAQVVRAGLMDEALPHDVATPRGGDGAPRLFAGEELPSPHDVRVVQLLEEDGFLFYRLAMRP